MLLRKLSLAKMSCSGNGNFTTKFSILVKIKKTERNLRKLQAIISLLKLSGGL